MGNNNMFRGPLRIESTRVRRLYTGGALLDIFRGNGTTEDGYTPEDWVGSTTQAVNRDPIPGEGISCVRVAGESVSLAAIAADKEKMAMVFGSRALETCAPGILVKLLDAQVTLALQTHPDKYLTKRHFGGSHGKCESWIVLGGRSIGSEEPHVYFGFRDGVTPAEFERSYYAQDSEALKKLLNRIPVVPGDVFFIAPNCIHAIGAGTFLLEIQEPSDYVFQFERAGSCWELQDYEVHMGLGDSVMLDSIDYTLVGERLLQKHFRHVNLCDEGESVTSLFTADQQEYFAGEVIRVGGGNVPVLARMIPKQLGLRPVRIGVVVQGSLMIESEGGNLIVSQGDTYLIPAETSLVTYTSLAGEPDSLAVVMEAWTTVPGR